MPAEKVVPFRCMGEIMMISLRVGRYEKGKHLAIEMFDNDGIPFARPRKIVCNRQESID